MEKKLDKLAAMVISMQQNQEGREGRRDNPTGPIPTPQQQSTNSSANSSPKFFPSPALKQVSVPGQLSTLIHKLQLDMGSKKGNFFSIMALEINRLKKEDVDESKLRCQCSCYSNTTSRKKILDNLHENLKKHGISFDERRKEYGFIKHDKNSLKQAGNPRPAIQGLCAVEGALLCIEFGLPAICEIIIDREGSVQYAKATADGFNPKISEEEFNVANIEIPIIINHLGDYYQALRAPSNTCASDTKDTGAGAIPLGSL